MRRDLPTGRVTFVFTDVEGSTALLHELGAERFAEALADHRATVREAFQRHGGVEVDTQGDAFFYAFADPSGAVRGAEEAQAALASGRIRIRSGIHTGAPHLGPEGYVGEDVHLGARIAAAGHGGQVLLSRATRDLVEADVKELGEHRLKDFATPVAIFQLGFDPFPPLKTISNTNLPRPASEFFGRDREVTEISAMLRSGARLVSLTGPGGTGKTRLAIETAAELVGEFKAGVFWIELAPVSDPALVLPTVAQVIGAKNDLSSHIGERPLLLVLDNLEQVIDAAPELAKLVESCRNLHLLVTSRELLRVRGETEYAVLPLADPDAIALFCSRAEVEADDAVMQLCRALDNLPLAIELAAARAHVLSADQILARLGHRLDLLKGGRDSDPRQKTLRATIEWSYELLARDERESFARLSVFRGGCTLEAAETVADADLDLLQSLAEKSLLRHDRERFWMLETIREFALERLADSGGLPERTARHAAHYLEFAEAHEWALRARAADPAVFGAGTAELDNLRAALDHYQSASDGESAQRLAGAIDELFCFTGMLHEGKRRLDAALALGGASTLARAKALSGAAHMNRDTGDSALALEQALAAAEVCQRLGTPADEAPALMVVGHAAAELEDWELGRAAFVEASKLFEEAGGTEAAVQSRRLAAWMLSELGDRQGAVRLLRECLQTARELGSRSLEANFLGGLTTYAAVDGNAEEALAYSGQAVRILSELGFRRALTQEICRRAEALSLVGRMADAARLLGFSEAQHEEQGVAMMGYLLREKERTLGRIQAQLDEEAISAAWAEGRKLSVERAVEVALAERESDVISG